MSRLFSSFVFFLFVASNFCFGQLNVNFSTATPNPGETVEINVSVSNFVDIELFQFGIGWDSTVASFVSISNVTSDLAQFSEANNIGTPNNAALIDDGELSLSWSLNSTEPVSLTDGTVLFTIVLNVDGTACDETEFMVTTPPIGGNIEVFTNNLTVNIGATSSGGLVSIPGTDCGGGGGTDGVGLIGSMESGISGTQTCVRVSTENFTNIASLQTGLTWNPSIISYASVQDGALNGISLNENETANGELKLLWLIGLGDDPVTLNDGANLFDICFDIVGNEGQMSDVSFVDLTNFNVEIADGDGISLDYFIEDGKVTVGTGGGGGGETCDVGVGLIGDSLSTGGVTNICVPFTSKDFTDIASVQTGIVWDENVIGLTEVVDGAMTDISVNDLNADMGELKLLWLIGLGDDPVTVADGSVLFELCFDVLGNEGSSSSISFVDLPNFNIEIANGDGMSEEYCTITSFVEVAENGGGGGETCDTGVGIIGDSLATNGVANICVPVTARSFSNVASVQTGLTWDDSVLDLTEVVEGALTDISVNSLNASMGELKLLWIIGLSDDPVTVPDETVLFELCFDVFGSEGSKSDISFVDLPGFDIEVANGEGMAAEFCTITGFVEVTAEGGGGGGETCDIGVGLIGDSLSTDGLTNVCISVTSKDFTSIASVQTGVPWDESVLDLTDVNDGAMAGISVNALNASMGELKILWIIGLGDDPVTVPNGTELFELCFDVLGAEGTSSSVSFVDLPNFNIEIANGDGMSEEYCTITGFVDVTADGGGGGETCDTGVGLIGDSLNTNGLTNVCISVTSKDFTSIASVQTGVTWDESVLDLTGVNDGAMAGISVNALNASMGELKLLWIIGLGDDPVTVPDGTELFELCFDVLGAEGTSSSISFVDLPNFEIEIANGDGMSEAYCTITGFVDVTADGGGDGAACDTGVGLIGDSLSTNGLTNVCVPVTSKEFTSIASVQTGVTWDELNLDLTGVNDGAMAGISVNALNASMGELKLLWIIGLGDDPVTVPDGTVLFEMCFDVLGAEGTSSSVSFVDLPNFEIEIANGDGMSEEYCTITGFVDVTADGGGGGETCDTGVGLIGDSLSTNGLTNVCIPVTSKDFTNIASVQTGVTWDESILDLTGVNDGAMAGISVNALNASMGELKLLWIIGLGDDPLTVPDGTVLFEMCFDVLGAEGTSSSVSFVDLPNFEIEIANGEGMSEEYCTITGFVDVTADGGGGGETCDTGVGLIGDSLSTNGLTNVCIPVTSKDFTNIASVQTGVTWDESILDLTGVNDGAMAGISVNALNASMGELKLLWIIGLGDDPLTVPDGTVLFEMCFDVLGAEGTSSSVSFVDLPNFEIEIANGEGMSEEYCTITGFVDVTADGGGGGETCDAGVGLIGDSLSTNGLTNVCIPVTSKDFTNIASVQTGVTWDESILDLTGVNDGAMAGISVNALNASMGELKLLWIIGLGDDPLTVPDGTVLFEMCFDVLGTEGASSSISFVDLPDFEIEIANGEGTSEDYCTITGYVDITPEGQENCEVGVGLIGDTLSVDISTDISFCMPVTTKNFENIASLQTGIQWDPAILTYTSINEVNLTNTSLNTTNAANGDIRFLWIIGLGDDPLTIADGATLFEICFDAIGEGEDMSDVSFVDLENFDVEIANGLGQAVDVCLISGNVTLVDPVIPSDFSLIANDVSADQGTQTCVDVDVTGFTDIQSTQFTILWDETVLTYDGVEMLNASICDLTANNFFPVDDNKLRVSWSCANSSTIPDSSLFFKICFDVIGECNPSSSSAIEFVDDPPVSIEITNTNNEEIDPVILVDGLVTVNECPDEFGCMLTAVDSVNCKGEASGGIFVEFAGAVGNVNCSWTGPGGPYTDCDLQGIFAGTYILTATDEAGSSCTMEVEVFEPEEAMSINAETTAAICGEGGEIDVTVTGGTGDYVYTWDPDQGNVEDLTDLIPGEYCVVVTDENGCTIDKCMTVEDSSIDIDITGASITNIDCDVPGAIDIDVEGGCTPLSYSWTYNGQNVGSTEDLSGLTETGTYTVNITDSSSPVQQISMEYTVESDIESLAISSASITNVGCMTQGSIDIDVVGGCTPLSFSWTYNGQNVGSTKDLSGLTETGTYTVNITDSSSPVQQISMVYTVGSDIESLTINSASTTNVECMAQGSIDIDVVGGCTPLSFSWTLNGQNVGSTEDLSGLTETGTYTVNVSDSSNPVQQVSMDFEIGSEIEALTISQATTTNISCSSLGAVDISVAGGCTPLSYVWTLNGINIGSGQDISELKEPGTYSLFISDGNNPSQEVSMDFVLTSSVTELVVSGRASNLSCNGDQDGSVELIVSGGCPNYVFEWDNGETSEDIFNLAAGTYCVSVNDQFCPEEDPIVLCFDVEEPGPVMIDLIGIQQVTNLDGNNGVIDIEPSGGAGGYTFEWTPNGSITEDQINMPPGEYCVTVTDQNNCSAEACYTIVWAAVFLNNCLATPSECSGECTGTINCDIIGGCSDVEIRINNVLVENFPIEDLCADTYTIEIVDECGNTDSEVIIIPEPGDMVLDTVQVICTGVDQRTGSIEIDIEGGTGPFVITWGGASECDGSTTCTGLGVGFYTVVVEDGGGCQALIQNIEITDCTGPPKDCFEARPIITPNNDGLNDQFRITCADGFNNANLQVYDRWGRLVYEQDDYDSTWEGTHSNGTELSDGGYMWVLEIQLQNGDTILRNGSLTILRTNF